MGAVKRFMMEQAEEEFARLDREFEENNPDLVADGWDRESWEDYMENMEKDD